MSADLECLCAARKLSQEQQLHEHAAADWERWRNRVQDEIEAAQVRPWQQLNGVATTWMFVAKDTEWGGGTAHLTRLQCWERKGIPDQTGRRTRLGQRRCR
jgi:hypothetical protein